MTRRFFAIGMALLAAMHVPLAAHGGIIFSDFGPGESFETSDSYGIAGANYFSSPANVGAMFTAGVTQTLGQINVAVVEIYSVSPFFNLGLYADDGTGHPGSLIESFQSIGPAGYPPSVISESSVLHPLLTAGNSYWLIISPASPASYIGWNVNSTGATGRLVDTDSGMYATTELPAFSLIGGSVPQPSSLVLAATAALAGLGAWSRGLHRQRYDDVQNCRQRRG